MLPLLALPFGAKVASTPEADAIDPEFRRLRIHEVVVDFLDAMLTGPILLVVEDAHWIDDASGELTNHLVVASSDRPWAGIITRRPEGSWKIPEAEHVTSLHLEPLDDDAIRELAIDVSTRALADRDLDLVAEPGPGQPVVRCRARPCTLGLRRHRRANSPTRSNRSSPAASIGSIPPHDD